MRSVTVSEARAGLPGLLDRVLEGEEVTITRHGRPVAVVIHPDALRVRRSADVFRRAAAVDEALREAGRRPAPGPGISPSRAEHLVQELYAERRSS